MGANLVVADQARARARVLLVAPHRLTRVGIRTVLERVPTVEVVAEAASLFEVRSALRLHKPSVAVVGPCAAGVGLAEMACAINSHREGRPLPMVALIDEEGDDVTEEKGFRALLEAGVLGMVRQGCEDSELLHVVETVATGGFAFTPDVTGRLVNWYLDCTCRAVAVPPPAVGMLTPRELDVLGLVGAGLTNFQISEELVLEVSTVKSHIYHVMKKLDLSDRAKVVVYAHKFGLVRENRPISVVPSADSSTTTG